MQWLQPSDGTPQARPGECRESMLKAPKASYSYHQGSRLPMQCAEWTADVSTE